MKRAVVTIVAGSLLYLVLVPMRLRKELTLEPRWATPTEALPDAEMGSDARSDDAARGNESSADDDSPPDGGTTLPTGDGGRSFPYRSGEFFGYVSEDGEIIFSDTIIDAVAQGSSGFVNYSSLGLNLLTQRPDGEIGAVLRTRGYPAFYGGRLFVFATNRTRVEEWTMEGDRIWDAEFVSLLTSMDANSERTVVGLLDGTVLIFGPTGETLGEFSLQGSRVQVVYGCAISSDSRIVAVVHGLDPQLVSILEWGEESYSIERTVKLEETFRESRFLAIEEPWLQVESDEGIEVFSTTREEADSEVPLSGRLASFEAIGQAIAILTVGQLGDTHFGLTSRGGRLLARATAKLSFMKEGDEAIYLATDELVGRLDVRHR